MNKARTLLLVLPIALSSCALTGAKVDVPSVKKAIADAVRIAEETEAEKLVMEFSVAFKGDVGVDGETFAVPITLGGENTSGTKLVYELPDRKAIQAAFQATQAWTADAFVEAYAKYNTRTGKIE